MKNYILFIMLLKIIFLWLLITHLYLKNKKQWSELDEQLLYWKERVEFLFITCIALLMLYIFNPKSSNTILITNEIKILLFAFALLILMTENWEKFFKENKLIVNLKQP
jgi:hypothetical protein